MCPIKGMAASVHNFWHAIAHRGLYKHCKRVCTLKLKVHSWRKTWVWKAGRHFLPPFFFHSPCVVHSQVVSLLGCTAWWVYVCSCFPCVHVAPSSSISRASIFSIINVVATILYVPVFMIILCGGKYFHRWSWCIFLYSFSGQCVSCLNWCIFPYSCGGQYFGC